ncbi:MAG: zinc ABC transporter solute-binding protein [Spirochaetales bacterium]|nr:zinc ABC transporter solute-binding protein [Spirochaetales bacterium]
MKLNKKWLGILLPLALLVSCSQAQEKVIFQGVHVVAAENFYGNLIQQIGGQHVEVTSLLSDPNVDPHEYEADVADAKAIARAQLVWENGGGYDSWMDKLVEGSGGSKRVVIKAFDLAVVHLSENEHVWYSLDNDLVFVAAMNSELKKLDPKDAADFDDRAARLAQSLQKIKERLAGLKQEFQGTPIALTETIFLYQSQAIGLKVLTPFNFMKAVAEGSDPSAQDALQSMNQVTNRQVKALVYNEQTVSAVTTKLLNQAASSGIPVVPITETMKGPNFQNWMNGQLNVLQRALEDSVGKTKIP